MDGTASGTATYAAMWSGYFSSNSVVKANYYWVINGSQITLTENSAINGDVLDLLIWAYPQDRPTGAIITGLRQLQQEDGFYTCITEGEGAEVLAKHYGTWREKHPDASYHVGGILSP